MNSRTEAPAADLRAPVTFDFLSYLSFTYFALLGFIGRLGRHPLVFRVAFALAATVAAAGAGIELLQILVDRDTSLPPVTNSLTDVINPKAGFVRRRVPDRPPLRGVSVASAAPAH
jgi:hypothetical protein